MMAKDSVQSRLESGMSFTEFTYQLIQGYDFYWLYKNKGIRLQMGGSDQWGNIVTGTELIRRKAQGEAFALTAPLVKKADGSKFGKSEGENIWLDPERTSPYKFYQYWINSSDEDAANYIRIFTLLEKAKIEELETEHAKSPHLRILQKAIAEELTSRVHSRDDMQMAEKASQILFGKSTTEDLISIDEKTLLSVFEGVPKTNLSKSAFENAVDVTDLLSELTRGIVFPSKGEARRMIKGGGVSVNKIRLNNPTQPVDFDLLNNRYLLVQKGKKNYYLVIVE
jgi:tyrosyl-tRNA synthetase